MKTIIAVLVMLTMSGLAARAAENATLTVHTRDGAEHRFQVEVVREGEELARGLMFRSELAADAGMLFDFGTPRQTSFWMKNTFIPLDMIFIRADGTIAKIHHRAEPLSTESIASGTPVRAVLEVRGGTSDRLGIRVGDRVVSDALR